MLLELFITAAVLLAVLPWLTRVPLRYNVRNVVVRWRSTAMTALAFTVVIALLTVMLGFVNGMYRLTLNSGRPDNVIILSERATDEVVSNLSPTDVGDLERQPGILREGGQPVASRETYLVVNQPIPVRRLAVHNAASSRSGAWMTRSWPHVYMTWNSCRAVVGFPRRASWNPRRPELPSSRSMWKP